jgi:hypothetical protein
MKKKVSFSVYNNIINVRIYDTEQKKNIGKIDLLEIEEYLTKKIRTAEIKKAERKNWLDTYKFNK